MDTTDSMSDVNAYSQYVLQKQEEDYNENQTHNWKKSFYTNLDLHTLFDGIQTTLYEVIKDLFMPEVKGRSFFDIFWVHNRPFYLGILLIIMSIIIGVLYFIPFKLSVLYKGEEKTKNN